jgi:hypothetical protein
LGKRHEIFTIVRDDTERLLWDELDGELDADGRRELEERLWRQPEARTLKDRIAETSKLLGAVENALPPADLLARVEARIARRETPAAGSPGGGKVAPLLTPWVPRFAYMAAGILVGVLGLTLLNSASLLPGREDAGALVGTISYERSSSDALRIPVADVGGELSLVARGDDLVVDMNFAAGRPVELNLRSGSGLDLLALDSGSARVDLEVEPDGLTVLLRSGGECRLEVGVVNPANAVIVAVLSEGNTLLEKELGVSEVPQDAAERR